MLEAWRMIGVHIAPYGNNKAEAEYLTQVAKEWGGKITRGQLSHAAVECYLRSILYQELTYPLMATAMTKEQCGTMLKLLLAVGLPAAGLTRTFPEHLYTVPSTGKAYKSLTYTWNKQLARFGHC